MAGDDCLVHVTRPDQAEVMRQIRNTCLEFMTGDPHVITVDEQQAWFMALPDDETVLPFLWKPRRMNAFGYGLIRKIGDLWWVSGGLLPEWRGKGHGVNLFHDLTDYVHVGPAKATAWLKVFEDNAPARRTYARLGYVEADPIAIDGAQGAKPVLTMKCVRPHKHVFHALHSHFGPHGDQAVHFHPCSANDDCDCVLIGDGRKCDGNHDSHREVVLP